jgi:hypothetical protein
MSMGVPVCGTYTAFARLQKDNDFIFGCDELATEMAAYIKDTCLIKSKWEAISDRQKNYLQRHYSKEKMREEFKTVLRNI